MSGREHASDSGGSGRCDCFAPANFGHYPGCPRAGDDMPDVGTPQATWRGDTSVQRWGMAFTESGFGEQIYEAMEAAVAADRRIQAAALRAKVLALPPLVERSRVLAVLDAVLGGDS